MTKIVSFAPPRASSSLPAVQAVTAASSRKSKGTSASGSSSPQGSLSFSFDEEPVAPKPAKAAPKAAAKKAAAVPGKVAPPKAAAKKAAPKLVVDKPPVELKGKKVRAPKDLDLLYGGKGDERPEQPTLLEAESPKKRLTREQREARKQLMKPDEGLLERLARATQIPIVKAKAEPRGKGWKFLCGRCGNVSFFQTPAGLCDCGAIAIKD